MTHLLITVPAALLVGLIWFPSKEVAASGNSNVLWWGVSVGFCAALFIVGLCAEIRKHV